jgi:hypothetical protein
MPKPSHIENRKRKSIPRFRLRISPEGRIVRSNLSNTTMEEKSNFLMKLLTNKMVMKVIYSRSGQFIAAGVGFIVGQIATSGFLEKIQSNAALAEFLTTVGIAPTEAGITGVVTGLFWASYNLIMTIVYGDKFKEIQEAHGLVPDRWAGPETMAAALKGADEL